MICPICKQEANITKEAHSPISLHVRCSTCGEFYMDPIFKSQIDTLYEMYSTLNYNRLVDQMQKLVKDFGIVIFTGSADYPLTKLKGVILREIDDVLHPLGLKIQINSMPGGYGD